MRKFCKQCKKEFNAKKTRIIFCSHLCYAKSLMGKPAWNKNLPWGESTKQKIRLARAKQIMKPVSEETKRKISEKSKGRTVSLETRKKISISNTGKKQTEEWKKKQSIRMTGKNNFAFGKPSPLRGYIYTKEARINMSIAQQKVVAEGRNPNFKGGLTPVNKKIRKSLLYALWRDSVFALFDFTCQKTGQRGGRLVVHHINNFETYPELRFDINNGIVLSEESHKQFHKIYGFKNNTKEQLQEFLN